MNFDEGEMAPITIKDVAREANVSISTVSYTISGTRPISETTRLRVLKAAKKLGYHANSPATVLASGRSKVFALMLPAVQAGLSHSQLAFFRELSKVAREANYRVLLVHNEDQCAEIVELWKSKAVDAFVIMEVAISDPRIDLLTRMKVPFVSIGRTDDTVRLRSVDIDFALAAANGLQYLDDLNHKHVIYFGFDEETFSAGYGPLVRSKEGFYSRAKSLNMKSQYQSVPLDPIKAMRRAKSLFAKNPNIDSVIVQNESALSGIIAAIEDSGKKIPRDISVLAFSDTSFFEGQYKNISSLNLPIREMTTAAFQSLTDELSKAHTLNVEAITLGSAIYERGSCISR